MEAEHMQERHAFSLDALGRFIEKIIDGKDPSLNGHHSRAAGMAAKFAVEFATTDRDVKLFMMGVSLHDSGKLTIPDAILYKPAPLTTTEYHLVKHHSAAGHSMLETLSLAPSILEIVLHHHENFDGTGYPSGLAGEAIPLFARAARIVDSFDALTEDRPYHQGVTVDNALDALERTGHHYDPGLLAAFNGLF